MVFGKTDPRMPVVRDEIFGPVPVAMPFDDDDDLIRIAAEANGSERAAAARRSSSTPT